MTEEAKIKKVLRAWLKAIGAYRFSPVQMGIGAPTLDELCCIRGKFVGIEVKREGQVPTPRQVFTMMEIKKSGGIAIWGDSFESIQEQVKQAIGLP